MAASVWLVRHGERIDFVDPTWVAKNKENRHNPPLTERGVEQARLAGRALQGKGISKIYTSPFLRCVQTAHAIAEELGGLPVHVEDGMAEYLNPDWFPGRPAGTDLASLLAMERFHLLRPDYVSRVTARFPETIDPATLLHDPHECGICNDYVEPTEEQAAAASAVTNHITDRVRKAVDAIVHDPENADQHILLVGHGASVHAALLALNPKAKHKGAYYCSLTQTVRRQEPDAHGSYYDVRSLWSTEHLDHLRR